MSEFHSASSVSVPVMCMLAQDVMLVTSLLIKLVQSTDNKVIKV